MIDTKEPRQALGAVSPEEVEELLDRFEVVEKENTKLREALAQKVTSETILRDLNVGNGSINASFEGGAVHLFVDALANQFVESGAANYLEMQFHSEATGPLLLTLQRVNGKTPHQLRTEAEKERDTLQAKVEVMEKQEPAGVAGSMPGTSGFTMACFSADEVPVGTKLYTLPGAQPAPSVPECPYPSGWQNLMKHAIEDGAYLARGINEDEPVTENSRAVTMRMVLRLLDVLMAINNAAPEAKP